jgi:hypothetical protein
MWHRGGRGYGAHLLLTEAQPVSHARAMVELAKSGAATCRTCKRQIAVDTLRIHYSGSKFVHLRCWHGPDKQRVGENYFHAADPLTPEQFAALAAWVTKHNDKVASLVEAAVPQLKEKAISVSAVAAAPQAAVEGKEASFSRLSSDTMVYVFSFLSDKQLGAVERVSKAFLRAAGKEWKKRFDRFEKPFDKEVFGTHKRAYLMGLCHGCHTAPGSAQKNVFVKSIGRSVCAKCMASNKRYSCVAKKYLKDYGLTEGDVATYKIPKEKRPNPYGRNLAPMTVFLVHDLMEAAEKKASGKGSSAPAKKKAKKGK